MTNEKKSNINKKNDIDTRFGGYGLAGLHWTPVLHAYFEHQARLGLAPNEQLVLLNLMWRAGMNDNATPAVDRIARDLGVNVKTAKAALRKLKAEGLVAVTYRRSPENPNLNLPNHYSLEPLWARLAVWEADRLQPEAVARAKERWEKSMVSIRSRSAHKNGTDADERTALEAELAALEAEVVASGEEVAHG